MLIMADMAFVNHNPLPPFMYNHDPTAADVDDATMIGPYALRVLMAISICITPLVIMVFLATSHILVPLLVGSGVFRLLRWTFQTLRDRPGQVGDAVRGAVRKFDGLRRWWREN
jgi:hypothetical protein